MQRSGTSSQDQLPGPSEDATLPGESRHGGSIALGESIEERSDGGGGGGKLLERGECVGRYFVLGCVGSGGMGVVYAAYDPDLDRKIALKVLHGDDTGSSGSGGETRLLREAQVMARLAHPNVIAVHDVGTYRGHVFVAMEFVDGCTLAQWQREPRSWREVLRVYIQAGRGIVAAHAADLVHRDFKPANALLGNDGRVRVLDFGLARRASRGELLGTRADVALTGSSSQIDVELTKTGAVLGTPAYMAPEQHLGLEPGPASDQFSFCASLYEALYGQRAFEADNLASLTLEVLDGRVREPPRGRGVPPYLLRILSRGLRVAPESRYPSMQALLDELARDPSARRRRWAAGAIGAAALGGATWLGLAVDRAPEPCTGAAEHMAAVWNEARAAEVAARFHGLGVAFADAAWARAAAAIDARANAWVEMHTDACAATRVRGEQSDQLLDLRMACLGRRLGELDALVGVLAEPDETTATKAADAVHGLPALEACADAESLFDRMPPPDDDAVRERIDDVRRRMAIARAQRLAGRFEQALAQTEPLASEAKDIDWPPLSAEVLELHGLLLVTRGHGEAGEQALEQAVWAGLRADDDAVVASAALELAFFVGHERARPEDGERWLSMVESLLPRLPGESRIAVRALYARAALRVGRGELEPALAAFEQARDLARAELPADHPHHAMIETAIGNIHFMQDRTDLALAHYTRALAAAEQTLGRGHPRLADFYNNIGGVHFERSEYPQARAQYERALQGYRVAYGEEHPTTGSTLANLATVYEYEHRWEEAETNHLRALAIMEKELGSAHPDIARTYMGLGNIAANRGKHGDALEHHRHALEIRRNALGADHPEVAASMTSVGESLLALGRADEAVRELEEALRIKRNALAPEHSSIEYTKSMLENARRAAG